MAYVAQVFGSTLKRLRMQRGFTQYQLAGHDRNDGGPGHCRPLRHPRHPRPLDRPLRRRRRGSDHSSESGRRWRRWGFRYPS
jgi:hypothetical protein